MTPGRIAFPCAVAAPVLIVAGLLVPDPWEGTTNRAISSSLLLLGLASAAVALVAAPLGLRAPSGSTERRAATGALIALGIAALFFGLLLLIVVSVEWS